MVDLGAAYTGLRLVKSGEELKALRRGAALSDAAIAALAGALRPGVIDYEVLARAEQAYVSQGGLHYIHYLGITAMDEPAVSVPAQWPTGCVVRHRDIVTCEIRGLRSRQRRSRSAGNWSRSTRMKERSRLPSRLPTPS